MRLAAPAYEEVLVGNGRASAAFAGEDPSPPGFDLLPGHARSPRGQRVAHVDHEIDARTEEIAGGGAGKHRKLPKILDRHQTALSPSS